MELCLKFINPIINKQDNLIIKYPEIDYFKFINIRKFYCDADIIAILDDIIKYLNCTIELKYGRPRMTTYDSYSEYLSEYYYYLIKLNNQFIYNNYIDKLIKRHIDNLIFEYENPYIKPSDKKKSINKKKNVVRNEFVKYITYDLFTGEEKYVYINAKTNEEIVSSNPNLLNELNSPKKKNKRKSIKIKEIGVPISAMTFSFKKK